MTTRHSGFTAPDFSLEAFLANLLQPNINALLETLTRIHADFSIDQIHETRLSIRTIRAHLDTFGSLLRKPETRDFCRQLQWLDSILGPLRDADVTLAILTKDLDYATSYGHDAEELQINLMHKLAEERESLSAGLPELLTGHEALSITSALRYWLSHIPVRGKVLAAQSESHWVLVHDCLKQSLQKLYRRARQAARRPSRRRLHRVRIQAKEVEYSFAAVQSLGFIADTETISLAGELHKLLGKYQDLVMLATWIKKLELTSGKHLLMKRTLLLDTKQQRKRALSRYQKLIDARLI